MFCFKQKTAYELRMSDWSSDVCSSDLGRRRGQRLGRRNLARRRGEGGVARIDLRRVDQCLAVEAQSPPLARLGPEARRLVDRVVDTAEARSEERRVGKERVSTGRSPWTPHNLKQKNNTINPQYI